jgi:hypothetical protein
MMEERINLYNVSKIILNREKPCDRFIFVDLNEEWFKNLFRKNKIYKRMVEDKEWVYSGVKQYYTLDELLEEPFFMKSYRYYPNARLFYTKPSVSIVYSDGTYERNFETYKEARAFFDKLVASAKQYDVPLIDFWIN